MRVHSWIKDGIERYGGNFAWPVFNLETPPRNLDVVSNETEGRSDKFYITQWKSRQLTLAAEDHSSLTMTFDNEIASLGVWLNQKAFPFTGPKYSIIGLETATSAYESLNEASQNHQVMEVPPGKSAQWSYSILLN